MISHQICSCLSKWKFSMLKSDNEVLQFYCCHQLFAIKMLHDQICLWLNLLWNGGKIINKKFQERNYFNSVWISCIFIYMKIWNVTFFSLFLRHIFEKQAFKNTNSQHLKQLFVCPSWPPSWAANSSLSSSEWAKGSFFAWSNGKGNSLS